MLLYNFLNYSIRRFHSKDITDMVSIRNNSHGERRPAPVCCNIICDVGVIGPQEGSQCDEIKCNGAHSAC